MCDQFSMLFKEGSFGRQDFKISSYCFKTFQRDPFRSGRNISLFNFLAQRIALF